MDKLVNELDSLMNTYGDALVVKAAKLLTEYRKSKAYDTVELFNSANERVGTITKAQLREIELSGDKIYKIKRLREFCYMDLKNAKEAVERLFYGA